MDTFLSRLRREAEAAAVTVTEASGGGGDGVTTSNEGGGGGQSKMDEMKDKLIEELKKCKLESLDYCKGRGPFKNTNYVVQRVPHCAVNPTSLLTTFQSDHHVVLS